MFLIQLFYYYRHLLLNNLYRPGTYNMIHFSFLFSVWLGVFWKSSYFNILTTIPNNYLKLSPNALRTHWRLIRGYDTDSKIDSLIWSLSRRQISENLCLLLMISVNTPQNVGISLSKLISIHSIHINYNYRHKNKPALSTSRLLIPAVIGFVNFNFDFLETEYLSFAKKS